MTPRCSTCRFWIMDNPEMESGSCRRRSPVPTDGTRHGTLDALEHIAFALQERAGTDPLEDLMANFESQPARWPKTWDHSWCGEYEAIG